MYVLKKLAFLIAIILMCVLLRKPMYVSLLVWLLHISDFLSH